MSNYNQNDNSNDIKNKVKETGKNAVRKASNGVKKLLNKGKRKLMKELAKGVAKIAKGIGKLIGKAIGGLAGVSGIVLLVILVIVLVVIIFVWMFNQGMFTGVMKEFGMIDLEEKEIPIMEDKYWQVKEDHSYFQEMNEFGVETTAGAEIGKFAIDKVKDWTQFLNWQAGMTKTANGLDDKLISANSFYVMKVENFIRDYYNRENNYLLPYQLLKELNSTLLMSNEMGKGYEVIYPEQFLKTPYHVNDFRRIDKDGKEFVWIKEDVDGNAVELPEDSMIWDYKVKEYNPDSYFKSKSNDTNYGLAKSYVYNNLSGFGVKKINKDLNDFDEALNEAAEETGVEFELLKALMIQESGGNPDAGRLIAGYGLFQIENTEYDDSSWTRYSGGKLNVGIKISGSDTSKDERSDVLKSALWAGDHLQSLIDRFDGDTLKGLQAYNYGAGGVELLIKEFGEDWINNRDEIAELMGKETYGDSQYLEHVLRYYNGDLSGTQGEMPIASIVRVYYQVDEDGNPIVEDDMQVPVKYRQIAPLVNKSGDVIAISVNRFNYQELEYKEIIWTDFDDEMVQDKLTKWRLATNPQRSEDVDTMRYRIKKQYKEEKLIGEENVDWKLVKEYKDKPISEAESEDFRYEYKNNKIVDRYEETKKTEDYLEKNSKFAWDVEAEQVVYRENWRLGDIVSDKKLSVKDWGLASLISYVKDRRVEYNSGIYFDEERDIKELEDYIDDNFNKSFDEVEDGFYPSFIENQDAAQEAQKNLDEVEYFNELSDSGLDSIITDDTLDKDGEFEGTDEFDDKKINKKIKIYGPFVELADFSLFSNPPTMKEQVLNPEEYYHFWYDSINNSGLGNLFRDVQMEDTEVNSNADMKALKDIDSYKEEKEKIENRGNIYYSHEQWTEEINLIDKVESYIGTFLNSYDVASSTKRQLSQNEQTAVLEAYVYNRHWLAESWNITIIREVTVTKKVPKTVDKENEDGKVIGTEIIYEIELDEPFEAKENITSYFDNTNPNLKFYTDEILKKLEYDEDDYGDDIFDDGFYGDDYKNSIDLTVPTIRDDSFLELFEYEEGEDDEVGYVKSEIVGYKLSLKLIDNRDKGEVGYILRHYSGDVKEVMPQANESYLNGQKLEDVQDYLDPKSELLKESVRVDEIMSRSKYLQDYYTNFEAWVSMNALDEFNHYDEAIGEIYYEEITTLDRKNIPTSIHSYFSIFEKSLENWEFWTFFDTGLSRKDSEIMLTEILMATASYEQEYSSNNPLSDEYGNINARVGLMNIYSNPNEASILDASAGLGDTKHLINYTLNCSLDDSDERLDTVKSINYISARLHNLTKYYKDLLKALYAMRIGVPTMDKLIEAHPDTWHSRDTDEVFRLMDEMMDKDFTDNTIFDRYYIQRVLAYVSNVDDVVQSMTTDTGFLVESIRGIKHGTGELINTVDKMVGADYDVSSNYGGYEVVNHKSFFNYELTLTKIVGMAMGASDIDDVVLDLFQLIGKGNFILGGRGGLAGDLSFFEDLIYNIDSYVLPVQLETPRLASKFGYRKFNHPYYGVSIRRHNGIDIAEPLNTPIYSIADGIVEFAGWNDVNNKKFGMGMYVKVKHFVNEEQTQFIYSYYAHLNNSTPYHQAGDEVQAGEIVGLMGSTGASNGSHLHFGIKAVGITPENANWEEWQMLFWENQRWMNPYYFASGTQSEAVEDRYKNARTVEEAIADYE